MGLDARDTLKFCLDAFCKFLRNKPSFLGVFLIFFLTYRYFPSVFGFLIYSSPLLACTVVLVYYFLCLEHSKVRNVKGDAKGNRAVVDRNEKSSRGTQSRRRNVTEKNREWNASGDHVLVGRSVAKEGKLDEIQEGKVKSDFGDGKSSSLSACDAKKVHALDENADSESADGLDERCHKFNDGGCTELEVESTEEAEDEDEGHKAVHWTADDQKNLMDLGTSEIERNKRLESLIAKRRAKKLMKMQVEKDLIDLNSKAQVGQIAPILIARNNLLHLPNNSEKAEDLPAPGSAPSVLLPGRNPFDLPYDPLEEKPNLLGDSFQQEFTIANQKDMLFCRHESFSFGSFYMGENKQEQRRKLYPHFVVTKPRALEGGGFGSFKKPPNWRDKSKIFEEKPYDTAKQGGQVPKPAVSSAGTFQEKYIDVPVIPEEVKELNGEANEALPNSHTSTSDGDMNEEITCGSEGTWVASSHLCRVDENELRSREVNEISEEDIIEVGFSGVNQDFEEPIVFGMLPEKIVGGPLLHANKGIEDLQSIKSIESEPEAEKTNPISIEHIGDEPEKLAVEKNNNSRTIEDLVQEPGKLTQQEGNEGKSEPLEEKNNLESIQDSRSNQVVNEAGSFGGDQSSDAFTSSSVEPERVFNRDSADLIASAVQPELVVEQVSNNSSLSSSPKSVLPEKVPVDQVSSWSFNPELHVTVQQTNIEDNSLNELLPQNFDLTLPPNAKHLIENSIALSSNNSDYEERQEASNLLGESSEANISYNINNTEVHDKEHGEKQFIKDNESESQSATSTSQEVDAESSKPDVKTSSRSIGDIEGLSERKSIQKEINESGQSNPSGEFAEANISFNSKESVGHDKVGEESKSVKDSEGESLSVASTSREAAVESPIPDEKTHSRSIEDIEGLPERTSVENNIKKSELPDPSEESTEANISYNINESVVHEKEGEEKKSIEDNEGESQSATSTSQEAAAESSKPDVETSSRSIEDIEGMSERTSIYGTISGLSNKAEENANLDIAATKAKEKEGSSPPRKFPEEANIIHNLNGLEVCGNASIAREEADKVLVGLHKPGEITSSRSITDVEVESSKWTEDEATIDPSKAMGKNGSSITNLDAAGSITLIEHGVAVCPAKPADTSDKLESIKDVKGDSKIVMGDEAIVDPPKPENGNENFNIPTTVAKGEEQSNPPPEKPMEETNIILSEKEAVAGEKDVRQISESVGDGKGDSQSSIRQVAAVEPSETTEVTDSVITQDIESKTRPLIDDEDAMDTSKLVEDNDTLDTIGDVKENKGESKDSSQDIGTNK